MICFSVLSVDPYRLGLEKWLRYRFGATKKEIDDFL
jgi:hypothetical protein